jgi:enhancing lycopene biosynthesis protein 2
VYFSSSLLRTKVIGACCIAPVLLAVALPGQNIHITVGQAEGERWPYAGTVSQVQELGATAVPCEVDEVAVDSENLLVTSPAYMYEGKPHEIFDGVQKMVDSVLALVKNKTLLKAQKE